MIKEKKIIIIGAGISGCTLAHLLAKDNWKIELYENKDDIGGLCRDGYNKKNILYHHYGPHIFHTDNLKVIEFVTRFAKFNNYTNKVLAHINKNIQLPLPINFKTIKVIYEKKATEIISDLKKIFPNEKKASILDILNKSKNKITLELIDFLLKNVYKNYTKKMWGYDIKDVDPTVISRVGITLSNNDSYFPTAILQGLPIGGYTKFMHNIIDDKNINLHLHTNGLNFLKIKNGKTYWKNIEFNLPIVFCGKIEDLLKNKFGSLPYRSLEFEFITKNIKEYQVYPIINYPNHKTMTRIVEYKKLTKQKNDKYTVISKEFPGEYNEKKRKWNIPYYPVNNESAKNKYNKYLSLIKKHNNLFLLGRLAEFKYYDMDKAILSAFNLYEKIKNKYN